MAALVGDAGAAPTQAKPPGKKTQSQKKPAKTAEPKAEKPRDKEKENDSRMPFPVPIGRGSKGLKIPTFSADGQLLQMVFNIGHATRVDENNVQMIDLWVETYDESGAPEMSFTLPSSNLDLTTRILSTLEGVTIRRSDFELTGKTMVFNTREKRGTLGGGVKMIIYNLAEETGNAAPAREPEAAAGTGSTEPSAKPATFPSTQQPAARE
ncbi:MAG: hypothetical protein M3463_01580 [Verrucomicrobiota bacterium]|nr:hypothetical protein [Verrucomicrobiota bacterium]